MATNDLIVDDEYCKAMGDYFVRVGKDLDGIILDYINILQDVYKAGVKSGEIHLALRIFLMTVRQLKNKTGQTSDQIHADIDTFVNAIDKLDKFKF